MWMRLLRRISDSEEEDPLTYGLMPPELKAEGLCCVRWLMSGRLGGGSAVRDGLLNGMEEMPRESTSFE